MIVDKQNVDRVFSGNLYLFHSFDVGDDIALEQIKTSHVITRKPQARPKYFKNYHAPLTVELPHQSNHCKSAKIHNFGVISLIYTVPFTCTLEELRSRINGIDDEYQQQSMHDVHALFKKIRGYIKQPRFFYLRKSYVLVQVLPHNTIPDPVQLKNEHGATIASILRFETEVLSEYKKNEILNAALGYYRGDMIIIDTEAAFVYDDEYEELVDIIEFANIQHLELQYFDRVLDQQLNAVYEGQVKTSTWKSYIPFMGSSTNDPVSALGRLRVDISVITERLENSIRLVGEPFYNELYDLLVQNLDLKNWRESVTTKLSIVNDFVTMQQDKIEVVRQDMLSVMILVLIFMEFLVGILEYFK